MFGRIFRKRNAILIENTIMHQQDGVPLHFDCRVRLLLDKRLVRSHHEISWTHLKSKFYLLNLQKVEELPTSDL